MFLHQRMQGTPGTANETLALGVLVGARGLADHQDMARAAEFWQVWSYDLSAGGAEERTSLAIMHGKHSCRPADLP